MHVPEMGPEANPIQAWRRLVGALGNVLGTHHCHARRRKRHGGTTCHDQHTVVRCTVTHVRYHGIGTALSTQHQQEPRSTQTRSAHSRFIHNHTVRPGYVRSTVHGNLFSCCTCGAFNQAANVLSPRDRSRQTTRHSSHVTGLRTRPSGGSLSLRHRQILPWPPGPGARG